MTNPMQATPLLRVDDLRVAIDGAGVPVRGVSFEVRSGEMLGIVGESGSGKSMTLRAISGLLPFGIDATVTGSAMVADSELLGARARRGRPIVDGRPAFGYVFQEPLAALNPGFTIRTHLYEAMRANGIRGSRKEMTDRIVAALDEVRLPDPAALLGKYPHELSGGMRQRVVIALALIGDPHVLLADEPTTALDVTVAAEVLDLVQTLQRTRSLATVLVSHDLSLIAERCGRVVVMKSGELVESGDADALLAQPQHPYTQLLLQATVDPFQPSPYIGVPGVAPSVAASSGGDDALLRANDVTVRYGSPRRPAAQTVAVDGIDIAVGQGEVVGVVGESGSGKSSLIKAIAGMESMQQGSVALEGIPLEDDRDRARLTGNVQVVFQDPYSSLNPRMPIDVAVGRAVAIHESGLSRAERMTRTAQLLTDVGISPELHRRFPRELSGGQRQRVVIARALAASPRVLLADEPTSALDVSVQAQILMLLRRLVEERGIGIILITHDFAAVRAVADRVVVMQQGRIVEAAETDQLISAPQHPYTQRLLASVPSSSRAAHAYRSESAETGGNDVR